MSPFFCRSVFFIFLSLIFHAGVSADDRIEFDSSASASNLLALRLVNRVTWGATDHDVRTALDKGVSSWLDSQTKGVEEDLPAEVRLLIAGMEISRIPASKLAIDIEAERRSAISLGGIAEKSAAIAAYDQHIRRIQREAQRRFIFRALYSKDQLREQMTWFWMNHFNVDVRKDNIRVLIADYENSAIRPHSLGKFVDLLKATARHPAMLRYLDNASNVVGQRNENYARELMELHTLGVGSGYSQADVQELARVLTGVGVNLSSSTSLSVPPPDELGRRYIRDGVFEFNPRRHDYGAKIVLGEPLTRRGLDEVDEVLNRLANNPATARFISYKIASYLMSDSPPASVIKKMSDTFLSSEGDIGAVLRTLFGTEEFAASLGKKFRDPIHYAIAGIRLTYQNEYVSTADPIIEWMSTMGQPLYGRETPDGYSLMQSAWASSGQMTKRFEVARSIGADGAALFKSSEGSIKSEAVPLLSQSNSVRMLTATFSAGTREALAQAKTPQDWNTFLLASPEFMHR